MEKVVYDSPEVTGLPEPTTVTAPAFVRSKETHREVIEPEIRSSAEVSHGGGKITRTRYVLGRASKEISTDDGKSWQAQIDEGEMAELGRRVEEAQRQHLKNQAEKRVVTEINDGHHLISHDGGETFGPDTRYKEYGGSW